MAEETRITSTMGQVAALAEQSAPPCTMVIFGASGDLTKRLLMPALYNLACDRQVNLLIE
jgi:glucose-6-phosphate 1-dehydrogenase